MRLAIGIGSVGSGCPDIHDDVRYVQAGEALGIDYAWSAEAWGRDAVSPIAYLAAVTNRIKLGTGIMQVTARVPVMTAMTALTLANLSNDRFVLGLGVSGPQVVEGLHGVPFQPALTRLKETVAIVRQAFNGEKIHHQGKVYELPRAGGEGKSLRLDHVARPDLPIFFATLAPRSLRYTGEVADGWLGTSFSPDFPGAHFEHLRAGAASAGRSMEHIETQTAVTVAIGEDVDALVDSLRPGVAFQLGAMGSSTTNFYNEAFQRAGYQDDALAVQGLWRAGRRDDAAKRVPQDLVLKYGLIGDDAMIKQRIALYRDAGITCLNLRIRGADVDERIRRLERAVEIISAVQ
ncbi:MAG: LLM class flavin-dependent oxidoreductase [Gammaproteobacteria bacterium]|nr:LLM class flavin-dependent oxidoreductase [Gammaproteobacteria bacterium]